MSTYGKVDTRLLTSRGHQCSSLAVEIIKSLCDRNFGDELGVSTGGTDAETALCSASTRVGQHPPTYSQTFVFFYAIKVTPLFAVL